MKKYWIAAAIVITGVCTGVYFGMSRSAVPAENPGEYTPSAVEETSGYTLLPYEQPETTAADEPQTEEEPATAAPEETAAPETQANPAGAEPQTERAAATEPYTIRKPEEKVTVPPVKDKTQLGWLERTILATGFEYDSEQRIFYSSLSPWQKNFGFNEIYDALAPFGNMIYMTERFKFDYNGKNWMFQIWKGRYGILAGAEMGIYAKDPSLSAEFYDGVEEEDFVCMEFKLYKDGKLYMFQGPALHWWLTGFKLGDTYTGEYFLMEATYYLDDAHMADALEGAVARAGFQKGLTEKGGYFRDGSAIRVFW